jgi:hypothetical protein
MISPADPTTPDYCAFADISEIGRFEKELREAEAAGAIRIVMGRAAQKEDQLISYVKLGTVSRLRDLLDRWPETRGHTMTATSSTEQLPKPPVLGETLLVLFCPKNRARHVMGDLEELFQEDIKTKGGRRAKFLYWAAVLRSIGPLLWMKVRGTGFIALVLEVGRHWSGMS